MNIEISDSDVGTFWEMLERSVSDLGGAIDGNTIHLSSVGKSDTEDTILEYARFLTLYRKLRKAAGKRGAIRGGTNPWHTSASVAPKENSMNKRESPPLALELSRVVNSWDRGDTQQESSPIQLTTKQLETVKEWAADDRLWANRETVEFNLEVFSRAIIAQERQRAESPAPLKGEQK